MRRSLLGLVALCVGLSLATTVSAYKSKKDFEGGTISGIVKFQGAPPPRKTLEVNKNKDICGKNPIQDDSLVVGSNGGVQWAVARLVGIESGKKWKKKRY